MHIDTVKSGDTWQAHQAMLFDGGRRRGEVSTHSQLTLIGWSGDAMSVVRSITAAAPARATD